MPAVSLTRVRVRKLKFLWRFLKAHKALNAHAVVADGFMCGRLLLDRDWTFWTMILWSDAEAMQRFREGAAHEQMKRCVIDWCDMAMTHQWEARALPRWAEAHRIMLKEGRLVRLKHPAAEQHARLIYPPKTWIPESTLTPRLAG